MIKKRYLAMTWVILGAALIWLLWLNRNKVAPQVFNEPLPTYLNINYPQMAITAPSISMPTSSVSCGCNPEASQYLSNAGNAVKEAEQKIESQLKAYTDSINAYFATNTVQ